ncbi:MAG TPA: HAMP domain-containing sensor histidine kinase [Anaerolineales bacterium]|nr:HAMP domain-containing sensor histidine kinase [Anaerolineales bacterium]
MKRKVHPRLLGFAWFVFVLVFVSSMIAAAFFLTGYLYQTIHWHPSALLTQIVNTLLGLLLTGAIAGMLGKFARSRGWIPEMNVFRPIIEALEKIAQGDFSIRVESEFHDNQIVGELAHTVNKMALELDQMENMRQEFISNVSHEIQSPLTSIRGFAQALENDKLSPGERRHYLNIIETESTRLSRITEDLLRLAALESDKVKFEPRVYRLDKQIRSLILTCEPQWRDKDLNLDISLAELEIAADEDLLSQVWINLVHNSIKFTARQGKISVDLCQRGDQVEFTITDTGIGIAEEERTRIFERFYKADPARARSNGGSGLGLSIVKKIVDLHRGTIEVESKMGAGTTFIVSLPIK